MFVWRVSFALSAYFPIISSPHQNDYVVCYICFSSLVLNSNNDLCFDFHNPIFSKCLARIFIVWEPFLCSATHHDLEKGKPNKTKIIRLETKSLSYFE
jgi:hypothetical protein